MEDLKCVEGFVRLCDDGFKQNWHERNGGNLTYRMTDEEVKEASKYFYKEPGDWVPMGVCGENLAGSFFISTGSGKFMRNVPLCPEENIGIVEINEKGDAYRIRWGLINGARPTSEFPSHYLNHCVRAKVTDGANRVIYHCHPANLIALTFILPLTDKDFSRVLWQSMTECPVIFPEGVGVVPWMVPGGSDIADATSKLMEKYQAAVWAHHGIFVSGPDFDNAFGLAHTIEKSAEIALKIMSSGRPVLQTITDEDFKLIEPDFGITINREFLD